MGNYCCYARDALLKPQFDTQKADISDRSTAIYEEISKLYELVREITSAPAATATVPNWTNGQYPAYFLFLERIRNRKGRENRERDYKITMTPEEDEEALEAIEWFYASIQSTHTSILSPPDPDWPVVIKTMAQNEEELKQIEKRLWLCENSLKLHRLSHLENGNGNGGSEDWKLTDRKSDMKIKETWELLGKVLLVAGESRKMLEEFHVQR